MTIQKTNLAEETNVHTLAINATAATKEPPCSSINSKIPLRKTIQHPQHFPNALNNSNISNPYNEIRISDSRKLSNLPPKTRTRTDSPKRPLPKERKAPSFGFSARFRPRPRRAIGRRARGPAPRAPRLAGLRAVHKPLISRGLTCRRAIVITALIRGNFPRWRMCM